MGTQGEIEEERESMASLNNYSKVPAPSSSSHIKIIAVNGNSESFTDLSHNTLHEQFKRVPQRFPARQARPFQIQNLPISNDPHIPKKFKRILH